MRFWSSSQVFQSPQHFFQVQQLAIEFSSSPNAINSKFQTATVHSRAWENSFAIQLSHIIFKAFTRRRRSPGTSRQLSSSSVHGILIQLHKALAGRTRSRSNKFILISLFSFLSFSGNSRLSSFMNSFTQTHKHNKVISSNTISEEMRKLLIRSLKGRKAQ